MKKALQFDEAPPMSEEPPPCQAPGVLGEQRGGGPQDWPDRTLNGLGLLLKEGENLALSPGCERSMEQNCDTCSNGTRLNVDRSGETRLKCDHYSGEPRLIDFGSPVCRGPESRPSQSRILQLFSSVERPRARAGPPTPPAAWPALSGLRVMGSFKKLRSSVLQGIQSRGAAAANQEAGHGAAANQEPGDSTAAKQHKSKEGQSVWNRPGMGKDVQDELGMRMACAVGSVSLQQSGAGCSPPPQTLAPVAPSHPPSPVAPAQTTASATVLSRLSRSTDNLNFFRSPFKCRQPGAQPTSTAHGIKRTASASSVVPKGHSPLCEGVQAQKLVSSMTDLSVRQQTGLAPDPGPAQAPAPRPALSALSRLHDDYSRRAPCLPDAERRRRASPARSRATNQEPDRRSRSLNPPLSRAPPRPAPRPAQVCHNTDQPRRRVGRARPRPLSDYGQLVGRKFSIPEEVEQLNEEARSFLQADCSNGGCGSNEESYNSNGGLHWSPGQESQCRKRRPVSVIGAVDLYSLPTTEEKEDLQSQSHSRPPVPSRQAPPYRGESVRLSHCPLSQSTPIGLDRLGHPRFYRMFSADGVPRGTGMLDDSVSEEDCSFDGLNDDVTPYPLRGTELSALNEWIRSGQAVYAEALWDHVTMEEQELAFKAGDVIRVLDTSLKDWWWGAVSDREAWLPSSFVRVRVNQEDSVETVVKSSVENEQDKDPAPGRGPVQGSVHRDQMRTNVVNEIMNTERIYIKHLRDICEGYLWQCRKHTGMFTQLQLSTIFSNIEDIYKFHRKFLKELERQYNKDQPHQSQIGSSFLLQQAEFSIYSEYCNNHPRACTELHRLMKLGRYRHFFEACRLLQQMIDISISGFLLTPVQKICKYPLQLGELLKYTAPEHRDHCSVSDAYKAMKKVACLINERKRRLENIDTIAHWQEAILRWEGEDILSRSSELIHSGDLMRVFPGGKTQQRVFFLFDHQMVFCKKDILRRDLLLYRGRLDTDHMEVLDLLDGWDSQLGLSLKNAFRLWDRATNEECVFCAKKAPDKCLWLQAFTNERRRVQEDQEMGMEISESQRKGAILSARKSKRGKRRNIGYAGRPVPLHPLHPLHQRHVTVPTSIPQQPVFSLAEPKRKPSHLWENFARHTLFRK
ncbi:hypothetical protein AAFF_G00091900 [Aldrovandia affinis]|uniref:Spermatogenesis-associated protein 13 n=1 Tax=Aldrovandia affinis TaxID=143900 RepID=A0AAD7T2E5_9TELE|nr:hypothetical protein AAFF_G00091900 [Aldrovandia affinis]